MLVSPAHTALPHTLSPLARSSNITSLASNLNKDLVAPSGAAHVTSVPLRPRSKTRQASAQPRRRSPPSLHKQAALNASLQYIEQERRRQQQEEERMARQQQEEAQREYERRAAMEKEWAEENQQVSIIVTCWDDDKKCWWPVEACGPVSRELRMFLEKRKAAAARRKA